LNDVVVREESHCVGFNVWNTSREGFALSDVAYPLELGELLWVNQKDPYMMSIRGDLGMGGVNRRNTVTCLESPFAFALDTLRSPTVVAFLLKVWGRTQIEYNDYCGLLSATRNGEY
jgi:hypothetical protein